MLIRLANVDRGKTIDERGKERGKRNDEEDSLESNGDRRLFPRHPAKVQRSNNEQRIYVDNNIFE